MPLPAGLTPVEAGRIGLWLLGKRNHRAAERRRKRSRPRVYKSVPAGWFASIARPWRVYDYASAEVLISELCGVSERTAENWLLKRTDLPSWHARTLADYIERFDGPAVARELRAYADERDKVVRRVRVVGRSQKPAESTSDDCD